MKRLALVWLAACGGDPADPCADAPGTCVALTVVSSDEQRDDQLIDQLELDLLFGSFHDSTSTQLAGASRLPVTTAIRLDFPSAPVQVAAIVVAAKRGGAVLGTGTASPELAPGEHAAVEIALEPPPTCTAESFYCGGDKLAGDPDVLYICNGGGVPFARGRCAGGCKINIGNDDACIAVGGPCTEAAFYCGGNELDGDPQSLYQCIGGVARNRQMCANGCRINPGTNDACN